MKIYLDPGADLPEDARRGTQVVYVPYHIAVKAGSLIKCGYPNFAQPGFIYSEADGDNYFVRYWNLDQNGYPRQSLRTASNSERTSMRDLWLYESVPQKQVEEAIQWIEKNNATPRRAR